MLQEIQVRGGLKNDPIRRGGGIFSGITQLRLNLKVTSCLPWGIRQSTIFQSESDEKKHKKEQGILQ